MMYEADSSSGVLLFHRALGHCHPCRDFSHSCILFQSFSWISSLCSLSLLFLRDLIYQLVQASALSGPFFYQFSFSETVSITKNHSQKPQRFVQLYCRSAAPAKLPLVFRQNLFQSTLCRLTATSLFSPGM